MNIVIALLVVAVSAYFLVKQYKPQAILLIGGAVMILAAYFMGTIEYILDESSTTGFFLFDIFQKLNSDGAGEVKGTGFILMSIAGFSCYCDYIGASRKLVDLAAAPLKRINKPYLVLAIATPLCMFFSLFIASASGLCMLLMATIFPLLVGLGVSPIAAASVVTTCRIIDVGPASSTTVFTAEAVGLPTDQFFVEHQMPVFLTLCVVIAVVNCFWQKWADKKMNFVPGSVSPVVVEAKEANGKDVPAIYALFPIIPLILLIVFSSYGIKTIKMNVTNAMFIGLTICLIAELIRTRSLKAVCASMTEFFKGQGNQFAGIVTLIIAGGFFADGLTSLKVVEAGANLVTSSGISGLVVILICALLIVLMAFLMGSGTSSTFAFIPLLPPILQKVGADVTGACLLALNASGIGRAISPISGVVIIAAGQAKINIFDLVKRNLVPAITAFLVTLIVGVL